METIAVIPQVMRKGETLKKFCELYRETETKCFSICYEHLAFQGICKNPDVSLEEWNSFYPGDKNDFQDFSLQYLFYWSTFLRNVIATRVGLGGMISDFFQYINKAEMREEEKLFVTNSLKIILNGYYNTAVQLTEGEKEIQSVAAYFHSLQQQISSQEKNDNNNDAVDSELLCEHDIEFQLLLCQSTLLGYKFATYEEELQIEQRFSDLCEKLNAPTIWKITQLGKSCSVDKLKDLMDAHLIRFDIQDVLEIPLNAETYNFTDLINKILDANPLYRENCKCEFHIRNEEKSECWVYREVFYLYFIFLITNSIRTESLLRNNLMAHTLEFWKSHFKSLSSLEIAKTLGHNVLMYLLGLLNFSSLPTLNLVLRGLIYELEGKPQEFFNSILLGEEGILFCLYIFFMIHENWNVYFGHIECDLNDPEFSQQISPINFRDIDWKTVAFECGICPSLIALNRNENFSENFSTVQSLLRVNFYLFRELTMRAIGVDGRDIENFKASVIDRIKSLNSNYPNEISFAYLTLYPEESQKTPELVEIFEPRLSKIDLNQYPSLYSIVKFINFEENVFQLEEFFKEMEKKKIKEHFGVSINDRKMAFVSNLFELPAEEFGIHQERWFQEYCDELIESDQYSALQVFDKLNPYNMEADSEESKLKIAKYEAFLTRCFDLKDVETFDNIIEWFIDSTIEMQFTLSVKSNKSHPRSKLFYYIEGNAPLCKLLSSVLTSMGNYASNGVSNQKTTIYYLIALIFWRMTQSSSFFSSSYYCMTLGLLDRCSHVPQIAQNLIIDFAIDFDKCYSSLFLVDCSLTDDLDHDADESGEGAEANSPIFANEALLESDPFIDRARMILFTNDPPPEMVNFFVNLNIRLGLYFTETKNYALALKYLTVAFIHWRILVRDGTNEEVNIALIECLVHDQQLETAKKVISRVRQIQLFSYQAPMLSQLYNRLSSTKVAVWSPNIHRFYSDEFRAIANTLLVLHLRSSTSSSSDRNIIISSGGGCIEDDDNFFSMLPFEIVFNIVRILASYPNYSIHLARIHTLSEPNLSLPSNPSDLGGLTSSQNDILRSSTSMIDAIRWKSPFHISVQNILEYVSLHHTKDLYKYTDVKSWYLSQIDDIVSYNLNNVFDGPTQRVSQYIRGIPIKGCDEFILYRECYGSNVRIYFYVLDLTRLPLPSVTISSMTDLLTHLYSNLHHFNCCDFENLDTVLLGKLLALEKGDFDNVGGLPVTTTSTAKRIFNFELFGSIISLTYTHNFTHRVPLYFHDLLIFTLKISNFFRSMATRYFELKFPKLIADVKSPLFPLLPTSSLSFSSLKRITTNQAAVFKLIDTFGIAPSDFQRWRQYIISIGTDYPLTKKGLDLLKEIMNEIQPDGLLKKQDFVERVNAIILTLIQRNIPSKPSEYNTFFRTYQEIILFFDFILYQRVVPSNPIEGRLIIEEGIRHLVGDALNFDDEDQVMRRENVILLVGASAMFIANLDRVQVMCWIGLNQLSTLDTDRRLKFLVSVLKFIPDSFVKGYNFEILEDQLVFCFSCSIHTEVGIMATIFNNMLGPIFNLRNQLFNPDLPSTVSQDELIDIFDLRNVSSPSDINGGSSGSAAHNAIEKMQSSIKSQNDSKNDNNNANSDVGHRNIQPLDNNGGDDDDGGGGFFNLLRSYKTPLILIGVVAFVAFGVSTFFSAKKK